MILGIDHLAYNVCDMETAQKELEAKQYRCVFKELQLQNPIAKRPVLESFQPVHDIAYFIRPGAVPIEITHHHSRYADNTGPYDIQDNFIFLSCKNLSEETDFWIRAFGLILISETQLQLNSPLPGRGGTIQLQQKTERKPSTLDGRGYTCLALLGKGTAAAADRIRKAGGDTITDPFEMTVNSKRLNISLHKSPSGALIELLELKNNF